MPSEIGLGLGGLDRIQPMPQLLATPRLDATSLSETQAQATSAPSEAPLLVEWHDTPDYYDTALLATFWRGGVHANAQVSNGNGALGGNALTGAAADAYVWHPIWGQTDFFDFGMGERIRVDAAPSTETILMAAVDSTGTIQVCVTLRTDRKLSIWRGPMTDLLGTSIAIVTLQQHLRLGFRGRVDNPGFAEVHLDGQVLLRVEDNTNPQNTNWRGPYIGLGPSLFVSHMYAGSGSGALIPGYLVEVLHAAGTGTNEWSTNTGELTWQVLDEIISDGDTSYAYGTAIGQKFTVAMETMPDVARIYGTRDLTVVRNIANPDFSASFAPVIRRDSDGSRSTALWRSVVQDEWRAIDRFERLDPFTSVPWTPTLINGTSRGGEIQP